MKKLRQIIFNIFDNEDIVIPIISEFVSLITVNNNQHNPNKKTYIENIL